MELFSDDGDSVDRKTALLILAETALVLRRFAEENTPMMKVQANTNKLLVSLGKLIGKRGV